MSIASYLVFEHRSFGKLVAKTMYIRHTWDFVFWTEVYSPSSKARVLEQVHRIFNNAPPEATIRWVVVDDPCPGKTQTV